MGRRLLGCVLLLAGGALALIVRPGAEPEPGASAGGAAVLSGVLSSALVAVMMLLATAALTVALRLRARRRRQVLRLRLMPGRTDEASPQRVAKLLEVLHQLLLRRWWQRLLTGQPGLALELAVTPGTAGPHAGLSLVLPDDESLVRAVRARLCATYRDLLVLPGADLAYEIAAVVRLKKRARFIHALKIPDAYDEPFADAVLGTMAGLREASVVQYALVPAPALFDRVARWRFRAVEVERGAGADARDRRSRTAVGARRSGDGGRAALPAPAAVLRRPARRRRDPARRDAGRARGARRVRAGEPARRAPAAQPWTARPVSPAPAGGCGEPVAGPAPRRAVVQRAGRSLARALAVPVRRAARAQPRAAAAGPAGDRARRRRAAGARRGRGRTAGAA